jgi:RNA 2',3'-cyclic 3'-phosphodiesterase
VPEEVRQRLFVAIEVREPALAALQRSVASLREEHPVLRWAEPGTWHITLAFVGSVTAARAADVDAAVAASATGRAPLPVRLDGRAGTFAGGVFSASVADDPELSDLAADVDRRLRAAGFDLEERTFTPHCTLARVPRGSRLPGRLLGDYEGPAVTWTARRVVVVRSRLAVGGVSHEVRSAHELVGG